mmetsp:Transcript_91688/g.163192  ORF Transcript_91688/g.163192 Transcript_91688/m.163192 type:complete len:238 (-) Transcript_91688:82-795(-)
MLVSCKRALTTEELLAPFVKRSRLSDLPLSSDETIGFPSASDASDTASACDTEVAAAAAEAVAEAERRRLSEDDLQDQPALKRLRGMFEGTSPSAASDSHGPESSANREASIRHWAEGLVKSLHGCPSVEQAAQRCAAVLADFEAEVRQTALREADQAREEMRSDEAGSSQSLHHTNKVLLRAVHHLAERCRRFEGGSSEVQSLRQALEQSQDANRRLQHSNEVLQEHIKVYLNSRG